MDKLLKYNPLLCAAVLSFILSLGLSFHDVVNNDGILYLRVAREFAAYRFTEGLALYEWAFYPALIAMLSKITWLSLEHSAILLNATCMAFMASGFVALTRQLGASKTVQWAAVLIFLVHPGINEYREYIIRDFGAWASLIWSFVFLCQFSQTRAWKAAIGWTFTILLSVLFRPEVTVWLILGPLALLVSMTALPMKQRCLAFLQCQSLLIFSGLTSVSALLLFDISIPANKFHEMQKVYIQIFISGIQHYTDKAQAFSELMSIYFKFDHAVVVLAFALIFYALFLLVKLLSLLYFILIGYAIVHRPLINKPEARILIWMLIIYASMYLIFIAHHYFISSRYLVPWITIAMVWVPFAFVYLWTRAPGALKAVLSLVLIYMFIDGVVSFGYSKMYLKDAGLWINQNTSVTARLYTDNNQVAYYADRITVEDAHIADVIALRYSRKKPLIIEPYFSDYSQKDFHNKREDGVNIFLKPSSNDTSGL